MAYTDFGFMRPENNGTSQLQPPYQKEMKRYREYMEHPSYKKRLAKEMFGDGKFEPALVEQEYQRRMQKLPTVKIIDPSGLAHGQAGEYRPAENTLQAIDSPTFYHEITHAVDKSPSFYGQAENTPFTDVKEKIVKYPVQALRKFKEKYGQYIKPNLSALQEKLVKDLDKGVILPPQGMTKEQYKEKLLKYDPIREIRKPRPEQNITQEYVDAFKALPQSQFVKKAIEAEDKEYRLPWIGYLKEDSEMKAKINSLRLQAIEKYGYDQSKPFKIEDYPELKKDPQYKQLTEDLKMSDKDIQELSKYIARIPSGNSMRQAQYQALRNMA